MQNKFIEELLSKLDEAEKAIQAEGGAQAATQPLPEVSLTAHGAEIAPWDVIKYIWRAKDVIAENAASIAEGAAAVQGIIHSRDGLEMVNDMQSMRDPEWVNHPDFSAAERLYDSHHLTAYRKTANEKGRQDRPLSIYLGLDVGAHALLGGEAGIAVAFPCRGSNSVKGVGFVGGRAVIGLEASFNVSLGLFNMTPPSLAGPYVAVGISVGVLLTGGFTVVLNAKNEKEGGFILSGGIGATIGLPTVAGGYTWTFPIDGPQPRPIKNFHVVTRDWDSTQFAASKNSLYWTDPDRLLRSGHFHDGKISDVKHLHAEWAGTQLAAQGDYLYWTDGDSKLRQGKVQDGKITDVHWLSENWTATVLAADEDYLYWADDDHILRRGKVEGHKITHIEHIDSDCNAIVLKASKGVLYWQDGNNDKNLRFGKVQDGKLHSEGLLSTNWKSPQEQFAVNDGTMLWCDQDKILRSGTPG